MKKLASSPRLLLVALAFASFHAGSSKAATLVYTGTAGDGNFSNGANYTGQGTAGAAPTSADTTVFNSAATPTTLTIGTANQALTGITFDTSAAACTIGTAGGNGLRLTSGGTTQIATTFTGANVTETINAPISLLGSYTFTSGVAGDTLAFGGAISGGSTSGNLTLSIGGAGNTSIGGVISTGTTPGNFNLSKSGAGVLLLSGANTYNGTTTLSAGTTTATNTRAFGNPTANSATQVNASGTSVLNLLNDGGTGTVTGQTITYGGTAGSASVAGYNVAFSTGTINVGNNGNAGSTGNTIQLGQLTQSTTSTVTFTSSNGYGINFSGGLNSNLGTATQTISSTATPVSFANIVGTSGRTLTVLGTGTVTDNGSVTATGGTAYGLFVGTATSGGITGNLVLKGTGSTITGGLTVSGGAATLYNSDSLGSGNAITLQQANATTLTTATLNLRNDADTNYGNAVTATSNAAAYSVDQATTAGTTPRTLTLGTLNTNQANTFTNGNGYNLAFGAVSSASQATFTNNMTNGTLTLASLASSSSATSNITFTFNGTSATATTSVGAISNPNAAQKVTQSGAGTLIFTGTNTYSGLTTVSSGTLLVNGANNGTGAVTVSNTGTVLGGNGSIAGATTVNSGSQLLPGGTVGGASLGANIASLRFGSTLALNGNFVVDLNPAPGATQTAGTNFDQIVTTGALTLSNTTSQLQFGTVNNTNLATGQVFLIALNGGTNTLTAFSNALAGSTVTDGNGDTYTISYTATGDGTAGNDISLTVLSVAPVPEPATCLGGLLLVGAAGWHQRRRWLSRRPATHPA